MTSGNWNLLIICRFLLARLNFVLQVLLHTTLCMMLLISWKKKEVPPLGVTKILFIMSSAIMANSYRLPTSLGVKRGFEYKPVGI